MAVASNDDVLGVVSPRQLRADSGGNKAVVFPADAQDRATRRDTLGRGHAKQHAATGPTRLGTVISPDRVASSGGSPFDTRKSTAFTPGRNAIRGMLCRKYGRLR